jgi:hypothetical protein
MIVFEGVDVIVQHPIHNDDTRRALAVTLGVPEDRIAIIENVTGYPDTGAADIVCVSSPVNGDFAGLLSVQVGHLEVAFESITQLIQRFSGLLSTPCLIPDEDSANPYLMWSIAPGSVPRRVALDPLALEEGRYVIAGSTTID